MKLDKTIVDRLNADDALWSDFNSICDCGGRLSGTKSEKLALALVKELATEATGVTPRSIPVPYGGWSAVKAELRLPDGSAALCHPLVRTVATSSGGLSAEVIDLGRALLGDLADMTGGHSYHASVNDLEETCEKIALELKSQYVIGYESTNRNKDGKFRKVRVRVTPPAGMSKLNVRTRDGYFAANDTKFGEVAVPK